MLEPLFSLLDNSTALLNGFTMLGVILVLVGIQNVTRRDLKEYLRAKGNLHKVDRIIAWGIFYIIFGVLITVSSILTISLYINK